MKRKIREAQTFDINAHVIPFLGPPDERKIKRYLKQLNRVFRKSPEGKAVKLATGDPELRWVQMFNEFSVMNYGLTPPIIWDRTLRDILYVDIPHSVIAKPEEAQNIIAQIKAFWQFLQREYTLISAERCLKVLNHKNVVARLQEKMSDPNLYSPVKLIAMHALEKGVDITDEKQMMVFIEEYNAKIQAGETPFQQPVSPKIKEKAEKIKALIKTVCAQHLNDEYLTLAEKLADAILRLPAPLYAKAREKSWAAGVVYALAQVNFLFDPSNDLHMTATDLSKAFGVSQQTASAKAREIADIFDLYPFHPDWTVSSMEQENPWNMLNGLTDDFMLPPTDKDN